MKKKPIFAVNYIRTDEGIRHSKGFFFALLIIFFGFTTPCGALMRPLPVRCSSTGSVKPFFYFHTTYKSFEKVMNKPNNKCSRSSKRAADSTLDARNALILLFHSLYPDYEFKFFDDGKVYAVDVFIGSTKVYHKEASELSLLTVLCSNYMLGNQMNSETKVMISKNMVMRLMDQTRDIYNDLEQLVRV